VAIRLDHVQVACPPGGEDAARAFYGDLLGLVEVAKPAPLRERGGVWFRADDDRALHVGVDEAFEPARRAHPALAVEDPAALAERAAAAGLEVSWDEALPDTERFFVDDPFGNRVEVLRAGGALAGVSLTALAVAGVRARESLRADRLFDDPLAAAFLAAGGRRRPSAEEGGEFDADAQRALEALATSVVIRTAYLDERLLDAARAGCRQVAVLGAGLDTRAFRLAWPDGVRLFELDTSEVLDFKDRVLGAVGAAPACERIALEVDLRGGWPATLRTAGLRDADPVAWLVEGLLTYFEPAEVERLMDELGALSAPGSRLVMAGSTRALVERWQQGVAADPAAPPRRLVELWRSGFDEDPVAWLAGHGWEAAAIEAREHAEALGRPMPTPPDGRPSGWLIDARRADAPR
jgi:methyltransferase (TIGR00027 family)